jgi:DNA modification methylase
MIAQSDFHSDYRFRVWMEDKLGAIFVNDLKWKNEWGSHPRNKMHMCFDSILVYCKGENWYFNPDVIQVPKATVNTKLNPSGRKTKTATAWIDDICLTTTSKERVKKNDGHLVKWQKPSRLYSRVISPFSKEGDLILDPFMGSGSLGRWSAENKRKYIGIEYDSEVYELALKNIYSNS